SGTKPMAKKKQQPVEDAVLDNAEPETPALADEPRSADLMWLLCCTAITALAIFMRFYVLGMRALHHDEGVNGHFLTTLFRDGVFGDRRPDLRCRSSDDRAACKDDALLGRWPPDLSLDRLGMHISNVRDKRNGVHNARHDAHCLHLRLDLAAHLRGGKNARF